MIWYLVALCPLKDCASPRPDSASPGCFFVVSGFKLDTQLTAEPLGSQIRNPIILRHSFKRLLSFHQLNSCNENNIKSFSYS